MINANILTESERLYNDIVLFLNDINSPTDKLSLLIHNLGTLKNELLPEEDHDAEKKEVYNTTALVVYYNIFKKIGDIAIFFELTDDPEENKRKVARRNEVQLKANNMTAQIENVFNKDVKPNVLKDDFTRIYNLFGFSEIIRFAGLLPKELEAKKDEILQTNMEYMPEKCRWTNKIMHEGVYDVSYLTKVTELTKAAESGVNHSIIKAFNTIDPTREPATYHDKHLPERSRVAVYNASIEKMIFDKRVPCAKFQFQKITEIPYQIITFIKYDSLHKCSSIDDVVDTIGADIYRIMATKYEEQNIKFIKDKREIFYYSYLGTFGVVNAVQKKIRENINQLNAFKLPITDYQQQLAFASIVKRIVAKALESTSLTKLVENFELTLCA